MPAAEPTILGWHKGGTTDSFGADLRAVTDGLALVPYGNGVHYDSEAARRPLVHKLVAGRTPPRTYCTDDGVGVLYRGEGFAGAFTEAAGKGRLRRRAGSGRSGACGTDRARPAGLTYLVVARVPRYSSMTLGSFISSRPALV